MENSVHAPVIAGSGFIARHGNHGFFYMSRCANETGVYDTCFSKLSCVSKVYIMYLSSHAVHQRREALWIVTLTFIFAHIKRLTHHQCKVAKKINLSTSHGIIYKMYVHTIFHFIIRFLRRSFSLESFKGQLPYSLTTID